MYFFMQCSVYSLISNSAINMWLQEMQNISNIGSTNFQACLLTLRRKASANAAAMYANVATSVRFFTCICAVFRWRSALADNSRGSHKSHHGAVNLQSSDLEIFSLTIEEVSDYQHRV